MRKNISLALALPLLSFLFLADAAAAQSDANQSDDIGNSSYRR